MSKFKCPFCHRDIDIVWDELEEGYVLEHIAENFNIDEDIYVCPIATPVGFTVGDVVYDSEEEILKVWKNFTPVKITDQGQIEDYWESCKE